MPDRLVRRMPPMANDWTTGLASGVVADESGCHALVDAVRAGDPDEWGRLLGPTLGAVEQANSSYFRFALEGAVADGEPEVVRLGTGEDTWSAGLGLAPEHSTRKLTVLLVVGHAEPGLEIGLDAYDKATSADLGKVLMFPAFLAASVRGAAGAWVEVLAFHAHGPAFR